MKVSIGQRVFDNGREERGEVVKVYQTGGLVQLMNSNGFTWLAAQENCSPVDRPRAPITLATSEPFRIPPGTVPYDCRPVDIRVGDYALFRGRPEVIRDLVGHGFGPGKTLIFDHGKARPAQAAERVYRRL
ncbi:hypothetical protein [Streptomyces vinaceus]|uniref:hypothetical protein n=1 Tax=Streptomyces vinaceus TaxID=1960 RepID=UPI003686A7CD